MTLRTYGQNLSEGTYKIVRDRHGWCLFYRREYNTFRIEFRHERDAVDAGRKVEQIFGLREDRP